MVCKGKATCSEDEQKQFKKDELKKEKIDLSDVKGCPAPGETILHGCGHDIGCF